MRIFLAGAAGVVGRPLVAMLVEAGHEVTGTTRTPERGTLLRSLGARAVIVDVYDRENLHAIVRDARPEAVIHQLTDLAGGVSSGNARVRVEGTRNLVDAALAAGVRRMISQSIAFVYRPGDGPAREDEPLDLEAPPPRRATVEAVKVLEDATAEMPEGVVLRYGSFYGPGSRYAPDGATAEQVRRGALPATTAITSFIHVADAARAAVLALKWPAGILNIVDDEPAPATEWLPIYAAALGASPPPFGEDQTRGARGASNARAREGLGWQPLYPSWREGFRTALD
jgi:nucleoside-diphosphate-sugar epimerase